MSANNYQYRLYLQTDSFLGFVENSESDWYDEDEDLDLDDEDADDDLESDEDWENRELYLHRVGDAWCLESIQIQVDDGSLPRRRKLFFSDETLAEKPRTFVATVFCDSRELDPHSPSFDRLMNPARDVLVGFYRAEGRNEMADRISAEFAAWRDFSLLIGEGGDLGFHDEFLTFLYLEGNEDDGFGLTLVSKCLTWHQWCSDQDCEIHSNDDEDDYDYDDLDEEDEADGEGKEENEEERDPFAVCEVEAEGTSEECVAKDLRTGSSLFNALKAAEKSQPINPSFHEIESILARYCPSFLSDFQQARASDRES